MVAPAPAPAPRRLSRANGQLVATLTVGQQLAGPPLGSAAFAVANWLPFLGDEVSLGGSAARVAAIPGQFRAEGRSGRPGLRAEIGEGLRFLFAHRVLRAGVLLVSASNLAFMAGEAVLVLFATDELGLGSRGYGLLLAAVAVGGVPGGLLAARGGGGGAPGGVGGVPGSLLAARVGERVPPGVLIVGGVLTGAVVMACFGLATNPWLAGVA